MEKKDGIVAENGKQETTRDGSICGFDSLHKLLQSTLSPQLFQVTLSPNFIFLFSFLFQFDCSVFDSRFVRWLFLLHVLMFTNLGCLAQVVDSYFTTFSFGFAYECGNSGNILRIFFFLIEVRS